VGRLFDPDKGTPANVPLIPNYLNIGNQVFGGAFPSFGALGLEMTTLLAEVYKEESVEDRGQYKAVAGLQHIMGGTLQPDDCAAWLTMFTFGIAFMRFCCLAQESQDLDSAALTRGADG